MSVPLPLEKQRKGRGFRGEEEPVVEETENWETLDQAEGEGAIGGGWKRCNIQRSGISPMTITDTTDTP